MSHVKRAMHFPSDLASVVDDGSVHPVFADGIHEAAVAAHANLDRTP